MRLFFLFDSFANFKLGDYWLNFRRWTILNFFLLYLYVCFPNASCFVTY